MSTATQRNALAALHPLAAEPADALDPPLELPPPSGLAVSAVELDDDQYLVLSFPAPAWNLPECFTAAEREIVLGMLRGASNEAIARERCTSVRTVANQIASIFVKLRVSSRIELAHALGKSNHV
jgi:DNA-binding NarL/FixJ family response regulator